MEIDLAGCRIHANQAAAGKDEAPAPAMDRRQDGTGIAGQFVRDLVADLAGELVEGDDAGTVSFLVERWKFAAARWTPTNLRDEQVAFDDRRLRRAGMDLYGSASRSR